MKPATGHERPRRSLILAGGGLKVAFQAGVLQVWLDEAGLEFDHADGASGGTFNLAMLCQGMSGRQIADNWRDLPILRGVSPNWLQLLVLPFARSLLKYDRWRRNIYPHWGLNFETIRQSPLDATFNLYNFSTHRLEIWPPSRVSEDSLTAGVSLPAWFEPVKINNDLYIDAVYMTDANLIEAVRRGADELWIIWTVSERSIWKRGLIASYFQIIETAGNGRLRADMARIERSNLNLASNLPAEFDRHVDIKILRAEVPLHYLINFSRRKFTRAVELGVQEGRRWCARNGIPLDETPDRAADSEKTGLSFSETMKGEIGDTTNAGLNNAGALSLTLSIDIDDVDRFIEEHSHTASISGVVNSTRYGADRQVIRGIFNLFIDADPQTKKMHYLLWFDDKHGAAKTLFGEKIIRDDPGFDVWQDTTTLFTTVYNGHLEPDGLNGEAMDARGTVRIFLFDFLEQLTTFKTTGPTLRERTGAMVRFGRFFLGSLWQIYGAHLKIS